MVQTWLQQVAAAACELKPHIRQRIGIADTSGGPNSSLATSYTGCGSAAGLDTHSVCADPKFVDLAGRDFTLSAEPPAFGLGFEEIDLGEVGPR